MSRSDNVTKNLTVILFILGVLVSWCVWITIVGFDSISLAQQYTDYKEYNKTCIESIKRGQEDINHKLDGIYNFLLHKDNGDINK